MSSIRGVAAALAMLSFVAVAEAQLNGPVCSVPLSDCAHPEARDCLFILRAAVGLEECLECVCDTTGDGQVAASDALRCLRIAVGLGDERECPPCVETTSTTFATTSTTTTLFLTTTTLFPVTTTTTLPPITTTTTVLPTTTTTLLEACPVAVEWTTVAGFGEACLTNADCSAGSCEDGECRTPSELDIGWTGYGHDQDLNEDSTLRLYVDCASEGPVCGSCTITGVDPSAGTCRCASDNRTICDEPFDVDTDCPDDSMCVCYAAAPYPITASGTPLCVLDRFDSEPTGSVDVDLGTSTISADHRLLFYLGIGTRMPCPVCGGTCSNAPAQECIFDTDCDGGTCDLDETMDDGIRDGVCVGGENDGETCDVTSRNTSFPALPDADGGAGYSLDCLPLAGANFTGAGLLVQFTESTETSVLESDLSCGPPNEELSCPCRLCSAEPNAACSSNEDCLGFAGNCEETLFVRCDQNADCGAVDAGPCNTDVDRCENAPAEICSTNADCLALDLGACLPSTCSVTSPLSPNSLPNACENRECTETTDGEGVCTTGPDVEFCDAVVTESGGGVLACTDDDDCEVSAVGVDAGTCTLVERLACFPDPIVAEGDADPTAPLLTTTFCAPASGSTGRNELLGLPGPVRLRRQTTLDAYCGGDVVYEPGIGGCLP